MQFQALLQPLAMPVRLKHSRVLTIKVNSGVNQVTSNVTNVVSSATDTALPSTTVTTYSVPATTYSTPITTETTVQSVTTTQPIVTETWTTVPDATDTTKFDSSKVNSNKTGWTLPMPDKLGQFDINDPRLDMRDVTQIPAAVRDTTLAVGPTYEPHAQEGWFDLFRQLSRYFSERGLSAGAKSGVQRDWGVFWKFFWALLLFAYMIAVIVFNPNAACAFVVILFVSTPDGRLIFRLDTVCCTWWIGHGCKRRAFGRVYVEVGNNSPLVFLEFLFTFVVPLDTVPFCSRWCSWLSFNPTRQREPRLNVELHCLECLSLFYC
jgi:hypothetical protein